MGSYSSAGSGNFSVRITNQSITQEYGKEPVVVTHDTIISSDSGTFIMTSPDDPGKMTIVENKDANTDNNGGVYVRQDDYVELIKKRYNELQNIGNQMLSEVYQWENMELDNREIQYALNRSLYYLQTPFNSL